MNLENLSKFLPLGSLFIILCSAIKLVIYYKIFDITIVDYLEAQEYLTLFIDDIILYLGVFAIGLTFYLLTIFDSFGKAKTSNPLQEAKPGNKYLSYALNIIISLLCIFIVYTLFNDESKSRKAVLIGTSVFGILTFIYFHYINNKQFSYLVYIAITIFVYSIMYGFQDGFEILEKEKLKNYEFQFDDEKIKTDSTLHYLGKSKNYLFLYNSKDSISEIFKLNNVNKIRVINGS